MKIFQRLRNLWKLSSLEILEDKPIPVGSKVSMIVKTEEKQAQIIKMNDPRDKFLKNNE